MAQAYMNCPVKVWPNNVTPVHNGGGAFGGDTLYLKDPMDRDSELPSGFACKACFNAYKTAITGDSIPWPPRPSK